MSFPRYSEYKDSGFKWLGLVPNHWDLNRVGFYFQERREKVSDKEFTPLSVTKNGVVPQIETAAKTDDGDNRKKVCVGDFVINSRSDRKGSSGLSSLEGSVSLINTVLHPRLFLYLKFIHYLFRSTAFQEEFYRNGRGIVADLWSTHFADMKRIMLSMPSFEEQKKIALFLDQEITKIDALIAEQEKLIELLKEKRQAVISHAVTKGLDPNVKMKDSGVEWLGLIAKDWANIRLKNLLIEPLMYGANEAADLEDRNLTRFIRITDITDEGQLRDETFKSLPTEIAAPYRLIEGDILLARSGATVGKSFMYQSNWGDCCFAGYLIRARLDQSKCLSKWLIYFCQSRMYWDYIGGSQIQATIQNVSAEKYGGISIPLPSLSEQRKIIDELDLIVVRLNKLELSVKKSIRLLRERRSALISAAVTGQIDVRNVAINQEAA